MGAARGGRAGVWLALAAGVGVVVVSLLLDRAVLAALDWPKAEREDWHRMFRVMGSLPTWVFASVAAALLLPPRAGVCGEDEGRPRGVAAGLMVMVSAAAGGLMAEVLKVVLRRERPDAETMEYAFRALGERTFSGAGLGMPSSHTMVAFAGAGALCVLGPRAAAVWLSLAAGCGFTRLVDRAHWLSDVALGAVAGLAVAWATARVFCPGARAGAGKGAAA
ncbi:MAG: phosphatase PAP2 family protein [Planctomycetota bacterium]|nr:phosphatase PAP2 family protein [Planctomycetota bacterium]